MLVYCTVGLQLASTVNFTLQLKDIEISRISADESHFPK